MRQYKDVDGQLYDVGDWVEIECQKKIYHKQVLFVTKNSVGFEFSGTTPSVSFDGTPNLIFQFIRKLSPSEVIVNIGCLSGTVREMFEGEGHCDWAFRLEHSSGNASIIHFDALDTKTRELVEKLLRDMEMDK